MLYNIKKSNGKLKLQLEQQDRKKSESQRGTAKSRYDNKMRNTANKRRTSCSSNYYDNCNKLSRNSGYKCDKSKEKLRQSFLVSLATSMATRPSAPMRSATTILKIASRATAVATITTGSATMMRIIKTNATLVARTSLRTNIARQNRATTKKMSASKVNQGDEENYHVDTGKIPKKKRKIGVVKKSAPRKRDF